MQKKGFHFILFASCLLSTMILFSSCYTMNRIGRVTSKGLSRLFLGDPRKNCNDPGHSQYMREKEEKRLRKAGVLQ